MCLLMCFNSVFVSMASNVTLEITPQKLVPSTDPIGQVRGTILTPLDDPPPAPWEHPFHHKFLTLNFTGYLIMGDNWLDEVTGYIKGRNLVEVLSGAEKGKDTFKELVDGFSEGVSGDIIKEFTNVIGTDLGEGRREFLENKCENDILTEIRRFKSINMPKDPSVTKEEPSDKTAEEIPLKYQSIIPIVQAGSEGSEGYKEALREETERRVDQEMARGFRIMFGRRDHHLVSSLVSALWSMKVEGDIRMAFIPKEQLLSVDMESRKARQLTLQLHPNKPVYKRRDRDEIRGYEEIFVDALPWCRVPGGRRLSGAITAELYAEISGAAPEVMWTEDRWEMSERKRLYREERKKDKDTVPLKVTDSRVQVNHFLPILKETTGFKGYIREERFYEGLKGLLYLIQVSLVEDTSPTDRATHLERVVSEELLHRKEERKVKREKKKLEEKEKAKNKT